MTYTVRFSDSAIEFIDGLDQSARKKIYKWVTKHLVGTNDPYRTGHPLTGKYSGYWTYHVGDYRLVAEIQDQELVIMVVEAGHRRNVYKRHRRR